MADIATALTASIAVDGQSTITANLPMSTYRHTNVGNGMARTDYATMGQIQDSAAQWAGTAGGAANALTLTLTPAETAYTAGQVFNFKALATNTSSATVAINALATKAIQVFGNALVGGEIIINQWYSLLYDGTAFQLSSISFNMPWVDVRAYGAKGDGTTDDTASIQAAITAAGNGGTVFIPRGTYKTTSFLNAENFRGLTIVGQRGQYGFSGSEIQAAHTGKSALSLIGSLFCNLTDISLEGQTGSRPKTGLLLGRSSSASAGSHTFTNLSVQGYYSVAGVYNIASEDNVFINPLISPTGAPIAGLYMSQSDGQAVGGLTGSSMEHNSFYGGYAGSYDNTAGSVGIFIDAGGSTGHHLFSSTFVPKNGGDAYIKIAVGNVDGNDVTMGFTFDNVAGEPGVGTPTYGLYLVSTGGHVLFSLDIRNLSLSSSSDHIHSDANVIIQSTFITTSRKVLKDIVLNRLDAGYVVNVGGNVTVTTAYNSNITGANTVTITNNNNSISHGINDSLYKIGGQLTSTLATGTPAFSIASTTNIPNLNASLLGGGTPASAAAAGTAGTVQWDASFIYVCIAANTWKRVAIATW